MAKNTGKVREKSGNFVSPEKWEPWMWPKRLKQEFWKKIQIASEITGRMSNGFHLTTEY